MALQTALHPAQPAAATAGSMPLQGLVDSSQLATSSTALASSHSLSAGLPAVSTNLMQSFPIGPPALRVMIPTNGASQSYQNSPVASQVCSSFALARLAPVRV